MAPKTVGQHYSEKERASLIKKIVALRSKKKPPLPSAIAAQLGTSEGTIRRYMKAAVAQGLLQA